MVGDSEVTHRTTWRYRVPIAAFCRLDNSLSACTPMKSPARNVGYKYSRNEFESEF